MADRIPEQRRSTHPDEAPNGGLPEPLFPGRVTAGVCMIAAPILLAILCLLATDIYKFHGHDFLAAMAAHHTRTEIFLNVVPLAIVMLMLAVLGLATMAAREAPKLARLGGGAALLGLCGPIFFVAIEFSGYQLSAAEYLSAGAYMYDRANTVPRISLNIAGPAIILGFIVLAVACYRAGVLTKVRAVSFAFTALLPVGFIGSVLPVSAVGFVGCAIALAPLGAKLLREGTVRRGTAPGQVTAALESPDAARSGQPAAADTSA